MPYAVIIPVYNRPTTLARAVESALAQTVPPSSVLIVDDGSTDETPMVAQRLATRNPAVDLIRLSTNGGAPLARNAGVASATTEFIAFLDSDDEWDRTKAGRQLELLRQYPTAPAAFTNLRFMWSDSAYRISAIPPVLRRADLFCQNRAGSTSSAMVRRSAFLTTGGFLEDMPSCQDWELWLRLAKLGPLVVTPEVLTVYHLDAEARISSNEQRVIDGQARITALLLDEQHGASARRRLLAAHGLNVANILVRQTAQRRRALVMAAKSLLKSPSPAGLIRAAKIVALAIGLSPYVRAAKR